MMALSTSMPACGDIWGGIHCINSDYMFNNTRQTRHINRNWKKNKPTSMKNQTFKSINGGIHKSKRGNINLAWNIRYQKRDSVPKHMQRSMASLSNMKLKVSLRKVVFTVGCGRTRSNYIIENT